MEDPNSNTVPAGNPTDPLTQNNNTDFSDDATDVPVSPVGPSNDLPADDAAADSDPLNETAEKPPVVPGESDEPAMPVESADPVKPVVERPAFTGGSVDGFNVTPKTDVAESINAVDSEPEGGMNNAASAATVAAPAAVAAAVAPDVSAKPGSNSMMLWIAGGVVAVVAIGAIVYFAFFFK